jgi:hypothetical protein
MNPPIPHYMKEYTYIYRDNYWKALANWKSVTRGENSFIRYTNLPPTEVSIHNGRPYLMVTHEQARKLNLLVSPYFHAIIKVYLIKEKQ